MLLLFHKSSFASRLFIFVIQEYFEIIYIFACHLTAEILFIQSIHLFSFYSISQFVNKY